jgi:20S proteasome subunit alpha 5
VDHARIEAQNHRFTFDEAVGVEALTQSICDLALGFGEGSNGEKKKKMSRPFGVALMMGGWDKREGAQLFFSDPSGTYSQYKAKAIGAGSEGAQSTLLEKYRDDLTVTDAEDLSFEILKQVMEDKISNVNVEVCSITKEGFHMYTAAELDTIIRRSA